jgi:hypothetical protein
LNKPIAVVAWNAALLLALLFVVEIGLRIAGLPFHSDWVPMETAIARFDEELGWSYIPNLSKTQRYRRANIVRTVHFDARGIRVPEPSFRLSPERPSMLFIGGSNTMGHGLSFEESFVGQLAAAVPEFQMVNLGVQAYGTDQALLTLKKFAPQFDTKVVVYTFRDDHIPRNGNYDRRTLVPNAEFLGTKPLFELDKNERLHLAKRPLLYEHYRHSFLVDLIKIRLGGMLALYPPYPVELTKALIREMHDYCSARGIRFILLNWHWGDWDYVDLTDLDVEMIDTLQDAPPGWHTMRIPNDGHPDARAGRRVADLLRNVLVHPAAVKRVGYGLRSRLSGQRGS